MVQRKVPSKISIQKNDDLKPQNRTAMLKHPSPRFPDGKNKGTQVYRKMNRSKSMKRSTFESGSETQRFVKEIPQPGKPPTDEKQKQLPNYMKSTSSFKARKEEFQVNSPAYYAKSTKKGLEKLQPSSNLAHMPSKTLARTSSLKLIRTIKKTHCIQPTKVANKNCSQATLCENSNSQRATCSSTLKDSKFQNYLELSHGATESEGTSLMKVCPYTYCSLNGHMHALLPPLKSFISAKRRMIKTQKNIKLGCLSPRKAKSSRDAEKINGEMMIDEKDAIQESRVQEDNGLFDVEIYVGIKEDDSKIGSGLNEDGDVDEFSNEAPNSENDLENNICNPCEDIRTDSAFFPEEEEASEVVSYGTDCETHDIEWEEGQNHTEEKDGYDTGKSSTRENPRFYDESISFNEILADESEEVCFQFVNEGTGFDSKGGKHSNTLVEDKELSPLLANQGQDFGEAQQEEMNEDYESIENNNQVFELEASHDDVLVGDFSVDTKDLETNQVLEQEMEEKEQHNTDEPLSGESNDHDILKSLDSTVYNDQTHIELNKVIISDESIPDIDAAEVAYSDNSDHSGSPSVDNDETQNRSKSAYTRGKGRSSEDLQSNTFNIRITRHEKSEDDLDKEREFNPCEPNYLPVTPDPEGEKVDLKHQDLDDRKNAEEWMIDYALQQTLGRLGARKKKVALLVEAFEKVAPPNYDFTSIRPIQACI